MCRTIEGNYILSQLIIISISPFAARYLNCFATILYMKICRAYLSSQLCIKQNVKRLRHQMTTTQNIKSSLSPAISASQSLEQNVTISAFAALLLLMPALMFPGVVSCCGRTTFKTQRCVQLIIDCVLAPLLYSIPVKSRAGSSSHR